MVILMKIMIIIMKWNGVWNNNNGENNNNNM